MTSGTTDVGRDIQLWWEDFGDPNDPPVLVHAGATINSMMWDTTLLERLADCGYHVFRFDTRDVGRSTLVSPDTPQYSIVDLADDVAALIGALDLPPVHVVGYSMGSNVGQIVAGEHPELVASLILCAAGAGDPDLPDLTINRVLAAFLENLPTPGASRADSIARLNSVTSALQGTAADPELDATDGTVVYDHNADPDHTDRHVFSGGIEAVVDARVKIRCPTLIMMGGEDDPAQGRRLAESIPGARYVEIAGHAHNMLMPSTLDLFATAFIDHWTTADKQPIGD